MIWESTMKNICSISKRVSVFMKQANLSPRIAPHNSRRTIETTLIGETLLFDATSEDL